MSRSTVSITVAKLCRRGYVTRKRAEGDSRTVHLRLTAAGARIKAQNTVLDPELVREMIRLMSVEEAETALQGMECMARYAEVLLRKRKRDRER